MTPEKALSKVAALCSHKEYCTRDIQEKLRNWEIPEPDIEKILAYLIRHNFLSDVRFAQAYARDKFRFNHWGKQKIKMMLQQKGISSGTIAEALSQLEQEAYTTACTELLQQKLKSIRETDPYKIKAKLIRFAAGRGFDTDTIYKSLQQIGQGEEESFG